MVRSVRWVGAALIAAAFVSSADAQTTTTPRHPRKHHAQSAQPQSGPAAGQGMTPSWLTMGSDEGVGKADDYVTGTFDQPSQIQGTFSGQRGVNRVETGR